MLLDTYLLLFVLIIISATEDYRLSAAAAMIHWVVKKHNGELDQESKTQSQETDDSNNDNGLFYF